MLLVFHNVQQRGHEYVEGYAVLFGIEDEFDVVSVERLDPGQVQIIIEMRLAVAPCPACGVFTSRVKDRPVRRVRDLPVSGQQSKLWWRKRPLLCVEALCPRRSFTHESAAIRPRGRVTERLRVKVSEAIAGGNRAVSEVAGEYGVSWPTAHNPTAEISSMNGDTPLKIEEAL